MTRTRIATCAASLVAVVVAALCSAAPAGAAGPQDTPAPPPYNGLATTPPLGWNDWYAFQCNINEQLIEQTADAIVSSGMREAGYQYVNLDDCWMSHSRDADGNLQADPVKFPHGIKAVADYVHARGLKLGIYEDVGSFTCAGYPGSYGHVQQDADTFAAWGVDFAKIDWCNVPFGDFPGLTQQQVAVKLYSQYSQALLATGRPILFSVCEWNPSLQPWTWAPQISNMWRSNGDYGDSWSLILANLDQEANLAAAAGPGHWNDPDILQVGLGGMSTAEDQAHFSAWAMLAAPLLAGNDLRTMSAATKDILTNRDVIAIDQDPLGAEATRLSHTANADVWVRSLANGDRAVMLLNRSDTPQTISTTASAVGLPNAGGYAVANLWTHSTTESAGSIAATVPADSAQLYRLAALHDEVDQYPPATMISVDPQVPPAYPGSDIRVAQPGQTIAVPASFENDGRAAATSTTLSLAAPDGWSVQGADVYAASVPTGKTLNGTWQVSVPASVAPGSYTLTATATYRWDDGRQTGASQGQGAIQVLVAPAGTADLSGLAWLSATNGYGPVLINRSYWGTPLTIHGTTYAHGLWLNANAAISYYLGGNCSQLTGDIGLDDSDRGPGTVDYQVYADGVSVYDSGVVTNSTPTIHLNVALTGAHVMQLVVGDAGDGIDFDNADIAAPLLVCGS
ncbi:MAG: NPCBM/NEW2 domain-containing protein [Micromonosporaceae bacterium]|nr:NPCBM/NEW2 domain-containing protein [Micromonosporaceae bacterium]